MSGTTLIDPNNIEQVEFLRLRIKGKSYSELAAMFNKQFNTAVSRHTVGNFCRRHGLDHANPKRHRYSDEELEFLRENSKGRYYSELTDMFNQHFGTAVTVTAIREACRSYNMQNRMNGGFQKGHTRNSGKALPDGAENTNVAGYKTVKDGGIWRGKHVVIWEQVHGPVPEGCYIVFGDGNRENLALDNLFCVSASQGGIRAKLGLKGETPELAKAGVALAGLYAAINERRGKKGMG